jgi:hypothetical protein
VTERRDEPGPIVERALESLRELPAADNEAVARIVASAARTRAQDIAPNDDLLSPAVPERRLWPFALAAAAVVLMFGGAIVVKIARSNADDGANLTAANSAVVQVVNPGPNAADAIPVPTQFVYDGHARHVMLVGDFNNWDEHATALEREPGSTLWSVTLPIQRGRHIYAFLVDSVWTVDNRAPVAKDPDFGVTGSVVLVGRP